MSFTHTGCTCSKHLINNLVVPCSCILSKWPPAANWSWTFVIEILPLWNWVSYYHAPTFWQWHNTVISGPSCGLEYTNILSRTSLWSLIFEIRSHCCQKIQSKLGTTFWQSTITQRELQISLSKQSLNTSKYIWHESRTSPRPRE